MTGFDDIEYASLTDVGVRRSHNQDAFAALPAADAEQYKQRGHVYLVADGMGAHAVGELASKIAADTIPHVYGKHADEGPAEALRKAFTEANFAIHTRGQQNREFQGMGTTGTALLLRPDGAWVGHVGDSRAYRIRAGRIEQLTFDHSLLWEVARRQKKDPETIDNIPSNVIVRSLGPEAVVQVDVDGPYPIQAGDAFLLCSDGLSGPVTDREMGAVIQSLPPEEACRFLIHLANLQGGPDNITAIVVRVMGEGREEVAARSEPARASLALQWRRFVHKAPWPLVLLLGGILLAGFAILLTYYRVPGGLPIFLLSALALVGGLAGLMFQNYLESHVAEEVSPTPRAQIHRSADCAITFPLFQRLEQARGALEERVKERNWQFDWEEYREEVQRAQAQSQRQDLDGALRHECRALLALMEVIARYRQKEESFKPLWDRAAVSS